MNGKKEITITVMLSPDTADWVAARADANGRAKCRELEQIVESVRRREARRSTGVLEAQGGEA